MEKDLKKAEIINAMMNVEYYPALLTEKISIENYTRLPLSNIPALGAPFHH